MGLSAETVAVEAAAVDGQTQGPEQTGCVDGAQRYYMGQDKGSATGVCQVHMYTAYVIDY